MWTAFKQAAGLNAVRPGGVAARFTKAEILEHMTRIMLAKGDISLRRFCRELGISPRTLEPHGTWCELRQELNLPPRRKLRKPSIVPGVELFDPVVDMLIPRRVRDDPGCQSDEASSGSQHEVASNDDAGAATLDRDVAMAFSMDVTDEALAKLTDEELTLVWQKTRKPSGLLCLGR